MEFFNEISEAISRVFPEEYKKLIITEKAIKLMVDLQNYVLDSVNNKSADAGEEGE